MASKRAIRRKLQRACQNKIKHESQAYAIIAMRNTQNTLAGKPLNVYPCGDHWHVGHRPRKVTSIKKHPSKPRFKPVDWWGEWKEQHAKICDEIDSMAMGAILNHWKLDEQSLTIFIHECASMLATATPSASPK